MRSAIILAAGKGTRMKSETPKVLHPIIDRPMMGYIVDSLKEAGADRIVAVVGYKAGEVKEAFPELEFAIQEPQLGSGHAAMQADMLEGISRSFDGSRREYLEPVVQWAGRL